MCEKQNEPNNDHNEVNFEFDIPNPELYFIEFPDSKVWEQWIDIGGEGGGA